jgi:hypothetical protein
LRLIAGRSEWGLKVEHCCKNQPAFDIRSFL